MVATPEFSPESRLTDFFRGLVLPFRATKLVFANKKLLGLSLFASLLTFISLVAIVAGLGMYADDFVRRFLLDPQTWYGQVGFWFLVALTFLLGLVVGANTVPLLLLAPLQDPISEATEELCGDFSAQKFSVRGLVRGTWVALAHTLARIGFLLAGHALLLLLNFIPGIGSVIWTVSSILWTMGWLAAEYLDAPMARHLYRFKDVRIAVFKRLPLSMGFGAAVYLLLWIPVLNFFFIPIAVVAGTLFFRGLRAAGTLGTPQVTKAIG